MPPARAEKLLLVALMAGIAVAALDTTVVATAMPTIVGELDGVGQYGWVFSAYLLAATTTVPLFSKLADTVGRKPIFLIGMALFIAGSVACGSAQSIGQLIAFRAVQGLGAGAIQPMALTIVGDIFEPVRQARVQGIISGVWGIAAILGPGIGGVLTDLGDWRWLFYINVPIGAVSVWFFVLCYHERVEVTPHRIDWAGALTLTTSVPLVLVAVNEVGPSRGWSSPWFLAVLALAAALLVAFIRIEQRAAEPIFDLDLLRRPVIAAGLAVHAVSGMLLFGMQTYVPPMVQGVHGGSALTAGAVVAVASLGWSAAAPIAGRWMVRTSARPPIVFGAACLATGNLLLTQIGRTSSLPYSMLACVVVGLGMGFTTTAIIVSAQSAVPWSQRGVVTGAVQFSRTIGGAIGVGALGAMLAASALPGVDDVLDGSRRDALPAEDLRALTDSLSSGLTRIYVVLAVAAAVALLIAWRRTPATDVRLAAKAD
jgi:EmrB/QacA subfamily drug resistance transporter